MTKKKTIYNKRIERSKRKSRKASHRVVLGYLNWTSGLATELSSHSERSIIANHEGVKIKTKFLFTLFKSI